KAKRSSLPQIHAKCITCQQCRRRCKSEGNRIGKKTEANNINSRYRTERQSPASCLKYPQNESPAINVAVCQIRGGEKRKK
ncbi:unnamed protein product, partial [Ectocarpus fasciculatus]